jgi:ubiquinone/menaquinone biosynthesis C-methylase UbiE
MDSELNRPTWQLPPGVSRGTWDYVHSDSIATEYDTFHAGHPLLEFDRRLVLDEAQKIRLSQQSSVPVALDLGCGTGRVMMPLAESGWRVLGIDLSQAMLSEVRSKFQIESHGRFGLVRGNLAQLGCLQDASIDLAYCLYSSIGMVQGRVHRRGMLQHIARSLRSSGEFIVHVHNRGTWWLDPGGVRRGLGDWIRSRRDKSWEFGDRVYAYRGLPSMYLHIFSQRELREDLRQAGLSVKRWIRLNRTSSGELGLGWYFPYFRAGGYIAVVIKSQ